MAGPFQGASFVESVKVGLKSPGPSESGYQARKSFLRIPKLCGSSTWFWDFSPETGRRQGTVSHQWFLSGLDAKDLTRALIRMACCHQDRCRFLSCFMLAFYFFFFFSLFSYLVKYVSQPDFSSAVWHLDYYFFPLQNNISCWVILHSPWGGRQKIFKISDAVLEMGEQLFSLTPMEVGRGTPGRIWWSEASRHGGACEDCWGLRQTQLELVGSV